jgi:hypothetical protein
MLYFLILAACMGPSDRTRTLNGTDDLTEDTDASIDADTDVDAPVDATYNACGAAEGLRASGTWDDPIMVTVPFVDHLGSTLDAPSQRLTYDCASDIEEGGGERVYALTMDQAGWLRAEVDEASGVDVDIHLLTEDDSCVARANTALEVWDMDAGTYRVVVDTWSGDGADHSGDYSLEVLTGVYGEWQHADVATGIRFAYRRDVDQYATALFFDVGATLRPMSHQGCATVGSIADQNTAVAGINGGFFDFNGCRSLDLVRAEGTTYAFNDIGDAEQRVVAWNDAQPATTAWVEQGEDYTAHDQAIGSWPSLATNGAKLLEPDSSGSFHTARHPRTGLGITDSGLVALVIDGRSDVSAGIDLDDFSEELLALGAVEAVNLDGGGSSTMWVDGCSVNGVVNFPSDGGGDDHTGSRKVGDGLYAWP